MNPRELAERLRAIADRIDASRNPSRSLVASDLRAVLASVPGMEWLEDDKLLDLSEQMVAALKKKSAGELETLIPKMHKMLTNFEFVLKAQRQKKQLKPGA